MNLPKAIELLTTMKKVCKGLFPPDEQKAVSLGIEALKRVEDNRVHHIPVVKALLVGETKE